MPEADMRRRMLERVAAIPHKRFRALRLYDCKTGYLRVSCLQVWRIQLL